jgi:hypothetical protein
MDALQKRIEEANLLIFRLERLSADSYYAHRASGLRGSLLRWVERLERQPEALSAEDLQDLEYLLRAAVEILNRAAREIPASD